MYKHFFKRLFDFCISLIVLICISPILLVITIWLHFANKKGSLTPSPSPKGEGGNYLQRWLAPAIFLQERPGKDGKIFWLGNMAYISCKSIDVLRLMLYR